MRRLKEETSISKSSKAKAKKLLKLQAYKLLVIYALKLHDATGKISS
jgi:hypothetical protein